MTTNRPASAALVLAAAGLFLKIARHADEARVMIGPIVRAGIEEIRDGHAEDALSKALPVQRKWLRCLCACLSNP